MLLKVREVSNQLTQAWMDDGKARIKIKNTAKRMARNTTSFVADRKAQHPDSKGADKEWDLLSNIEKDLNKLCQDVIDLFQLPLDDPSSGRNHDESWPAYSKCNCAAAGIKKQLAELVVNTGESNRAASQAQWTEWKSKAVAGCTSGAHRFSSVPQP